MLPDGKSPPSGAAEGGGFTTGQKVGRGRFTLVRFLGKGGMGIVWLAEDARLEQQVALKFLPPQIRGDVDALDDMRRETLRSIRLSHPGIIRIQDLHEYPGELFISMEYVDGGTLANLKRAAPNRVLPWAQLKPLLHQLCDALDYAHGEKVIHRDLKPANMMLDARGRLKLADFGIAAVVNDSMSRVSLKHSTSGTMAYMSPQQMNGQRPQPSDDIYALGATLYELLTSRPPFYTGNLTHQVQKVAAPPLHERLAELGIQNDVPNDVAALVMACLAKSPEQRPPGAQAVAEWIGLEFESKVTPKTATSVPQSAPAPVAAVDDVEPGLEFPPVPGEPEAIPEFAPERTPLNGKAIWVGGCAAILLVLGGVWLTKSKPVPASAPESRPAAKPAAVPKVVLRWTNSLGQVFTPLPDTTTLFSIWETRVQDYQAFIERSGHAWAKPPFPQEPTHPVVNVYWNEARDFCLWLTYMERKAGIISSNQSYRMPTDGEWSIAVGLTWENGTTPKEKSRKAGGVYPWGTQWPPPQEAGNYGTNLGVDSFIYTAPVGSFAANPLGIFDLGGNANEWCEDFIDAARVSYVLRGGGFSYTDRQYLLASNREGYSLGVRRGSIGFRCVLAEVAVAGEESRNSQLLRGGKSNGPARRNTNSISGPVTTVRPVPCLTNSLGMVFVPLSDLDVGFSIWETRVQDYLAFSQATSREWTKPEFAQGPTHPVVNVNWNDASAFCAWLTDKERSTGAITTNQSYRLSSDIEWSLAVGLFWEIGTTPKEKHRKVPDVYPWGTGWPPPKGAGNYATNLFVDDFEFTAPVGSFPANAQGVFDLGGNVWEWCDDLFDPAQIWRVLRGASWQVGWAGDPMSSHRYWRDPLENNPRLGFRVVLAGLPAAARVRR